MSEMLITSGTVLRFFQDTRADVLETFTLYLNLLRVT